MGAPPDRTKPELDFPGEFPPSFLVVDDVLVGAGAAVAAGQTVSAHYVGWAFSTGEGFDSSWSRGQPLDFTVGVGQVIAGWDEGLVGMRVGGRRRLTIPPHLAYGDRGAGRFIRPGETLVFVVDLLDAL